MFIATNIGASNGGAPGAGDDFWYAPIGSRTAAGARVSATSAMQLSTVFKCVKAISETIAMLPLPVYQRLTPRGKERADDHPISQLLRRPNEMQTEIEFRTCMQWNATARGNGVAWLRFNGAGVPIAAYPMHPDRLQFELTTGGELRYRYRDEQNRERVFLRDEVLHLMGVSIDGHIGLNPIEAHREAIGGAITLRDYGSRYFKNSARPPTWVEATQPFKDDAARRKWVAEFNLAYTGENVGKSPLFEKGMKLHALTINNSDAQWLEATKASAIDIAGLFRVPPHKIGILDRATWSNIEHQALEFVTDCVMPWCVRWEQTLRRDLFDERDTKHFAEHLLDMLLRGDTKTRFEAYGKAIQDGWMLRNEARDKENLNPIDGLDTPLEPMNMQPAGSKRAAQERGDAPDARMLAIEARSLAIQTAAAERIARKEVGALQRAGNDPAAIDAVFGEAHVRFVSQALAITVGSATAVCQAAAERVKAAWESSSRCMLTADYETARVAELVRLEGNPSDAPVTARDLMHVVEAVAARPVNVTVEPQSITVPEREVHLHAGDTSVTVLPTPPRVKEIDRTPEGFIRSITEKEVH